jgi:hypothetical protein
MVVWNLPPEWLPWIASLATCLHARLAGRLAPLLLGLVFARGRRTVASWLRAAGLGADFQAYYYFLGSLGRRTEWLAGRLLHLLLERLGSGARLLFALDDTPTQRYGPKVQGAGLHHHPSPGPTDQKFLYGHIWVTLAWMVHHPCWGTIGLPVLAYLYVRRQNLASIPSRYGWTFHTKLELAAALVTWLARHVHRWGVAVWLVVDGFYAKRPFLRAALAVGIVVVGRLAKNAGLWSVPPRVAPGQRRRGRPRKYGRQRLSLAKRAGQPRGWQQVECLQYGVWVTKTVKTFLATWAPVGGVIRVVLVREEHRWLAYFCTDPQATVAQILEAAADRTTIEQDFHDLKEVEGLGQQQVRNVWANVGVYHLNLWAHALVELWAWGRPKGTLCDRSAAPWDDPTRRPSHADRRKALQRHCLEQAFSSARRGGRLPRKMQQLVRALMQLVS